jgi:cellulase (glycosyl hydrolase family 5)
VTNNFIIILFFISILLLSTFSTMGTSSQGSLSSIANTVFVDLSNQNHGNQYVVPSQGVNVLGYYTTMPELRNYSQLSSPKAYYEKSFKIISQAGMNTIRYLFTWESYERNPSLFIKELTQVAQASNKSGINVIYANDQYHVSSWLDPKLGYGFPSFLFKNDIVNFPLGGGGASDTPVARQWWTNWYNRSIIKIDSNRITDAWTLQAEFLKKVVKTLDHYKSTLGYEILNEPIVYSVDQWEKLGSYNTFIANALRKLTNKIIVFDRQLPSGVGGPIDATPDNMIKMSPKNITNLIFKTTLYGLPTHCSPAEGRLNTAARTAQILGIPLWIGEFNIGLSPEVPIADINQTGMNLFIEKFKELKTWGWSFWLWSFKKHASNLRNFDLANITEGHDIGTTRYFDYLKNAILSSGLYDDDEMINRSQKENKQQQQQQEQISSSLTTNPSENINTQKTNVDHSIIVNSTTDNIKPYMHFLDKADRNTDTICPTAVITQINGTEPNTDYSLSSPIEPVLVHVGSGCFPNSKILVQGEAYDTGSGIKNAKIHLDGRPFKLVTQQSKGDWSNWSALVPLNDDNAGTSTNALCGANHRLAVRVTDNAGNVDSTTVFIESSYELIQ